MTDNIDALYKNIIRWKGREELYENSLSHMVSLARETLLYLLCR